MPIRRAESEEQLGSEPCGCAEPSRILADSRVTDGVKIRTHKCVKCRKKWLSQHKISVPLHSLRYGRAKRGVDE